MEENIVSREFYVLFMANLQSVSLYCQLHHLAEADTDALCPIFGTEV